MTKRKYRTDEEWLSLIQECRLSGLTDKQWCEAHQICPSNFYYQIQKFRKRACEIPESHSKTTLTAQKQEVVQVTFEQPAVSEHPQSCLSKDTKADAAILVQINVDLCQYFEHKKLKGYADFFNSSSSFCCGVI